MGSLRALDFAITRAQAQGDSLLIAHVLEWSPYSFLTPSELEDRHRRRKEELQRAETSVMGPVMKPWKSPTSRSKPQCVTAISPKPCVASPKTTMPPCSLSGVWAIPVSPAAFS